MQKRREHVVVKEKRREKRRSVAATAGRRRPELAPRAGRSLPLLACARTAPTYLTPCRPEIARVLAGRRSRAAAPARGRPCWDAPRGRAAGARPCRLELARGRAPEIAAVSSTAKRGDVQGGGRQSQGTAAGERKRMSGAWG